MSSEDKELDLCIQTQPGVIEPFIPDLNSDTDIPKPKIIHSWLRHALAIGATLSLAASGMLLADNEPASASSKSEHFTAIKDPKVIPEYLSTATVSIIMGQAMGDPKCAIEAINTTYRSCIYQATKPSPYNDPQRIFYSVFSVEQGPPELKPDQTTPCVIPTPSASYYPKEYSVTSVLGGCVVVPTKLNISDGNPYYDQVYVDGTYVTLLATPKDRTANPSILSRETQAAKAIAVVLNEHSDSWPSN